MVVEDDPAIAQMISLQLELSGYRTHVERDGLAALEAVRRERPDVVLLDIGLPGLDGIQVCRRLRAADDWTPILFVTARDDEVDRIVGLELGADDYITKPFGMRELRSRVRAVLRRASLGPEGPTAPGDRLELGEIALDAARRTVTVAGQPAELTYVEFEILHTLMASPGRVFGRGQLLDAVWGSSDFREPRTVDVHIRHLREKIEPSPSEPTRIQTVRGVGYRFAGA